MKDWCPQTNGDFQGRTVDLPDGSVFSPKMVVPLNHRFWMILMVFFIFFTIQLLGSCIYGNLMKPPLPCPSVHPTNWCASSSHRRRWAPGPWKQMGEDQAAHCQTPMLMLGVSSTYCWLWEQNISKCSKVESKMVRSKRPWNLRIYKWTW